jgi:hypothetical protein
MNSGSGPNSYGSDQPGDEQPYQSQSPYGEQPDRSQSPHGEQPYGTQASGEQQSSRGQSGYGDQPPYSNQPGYGNPSGYPDQSGYWQPSGYGDLGYSGQPYYGDPYGDPAGYPTASYGPPGYPTPAYGGYAPREHPQGTAVLVLGILSLIVCPLILSIIAVVMGKKALNEIDAHPGVYTNRSTVKAGLVCGVVSLCLSAAFVLFYLIVIIGVAAATAGG